MLLFIQKTFEKSWIYPVDCRQVTVLIQNTGNLQIVIAVFQ
jgi:hypothetical protein